MSGGVLSCHRLIHYARIFLSRIFRFMTLNLIFNNLSPTVSDARGILEIGNIPIATLSI